MAHAPYTWTLVQETHTPRIAEIDLLILGVYSLARFHLKVDIKRCFLITHNNKVVIRAIETNSRPPEPSNNIWPPLPTYLPLNQLAEDQKSLAEICSFHLDGTNFAFLTLHWRMSILGMGRSQFCFQGHGWPRSRGRSFQIPLQFEPGR